ncbi:aminotransferase class I/II-fold pyridoxal phosphate-dependent enzyme [Qingshengfaniella alkalisoli]|uniref:Aminotransferase class I/II-fold pyridoxal phosphate-dependent enzyme n=1 Tax=Qingshengfaniella alkalisoli TaxID=2599296 RepID=A0A5B8IRZ1_9RHOB|nr:aminotransferase class I/II-fold pyridoxal phosphate-dependent enzyme [Qingshengfaniella alkalisoli]QDY68354.1 aminotransferase class I/II-fold pyridoxal phosphate-dependent enzyme [Qingshengfaniella alkalisoli]
MQFPDRFSDLPAYAFPRLRGLLDSYPAGNEPIAMSIGEPKHAFPEWVTGIIVDHAAEFGRYPPNEGTPELREAIAGWLKRRYGVDAASETQISTLNGTREGLYNAGMALCPETKAGAKPVVLMPNPFYQAYAVSALSAMAEPVYVNATADNGFMPDYSSVPEDVLNRTAMVYICSPSNPQGAVADRDYWTSLLALAEKYDFQVLADECYSEIYRDTPPPGAMEIAAEIGTDPERVVVFHSLSKRSNLPGLRSGFVAGGPETIRRIKQLRSFGGAPVPMPLQRVSERAWADEDHVIQNRHFYVKKFEIADRILGDVPGYMSPQAGFFLWLPVEDGEVAALKLWREAGLRVLPGLYLSRDTAQGNPGAGYIRVALVAPAPEIERGLTRLRNCLYP